VTESAAFTATESATDKREPKSTFACAEIPDPPTALAYTEQVDPVNAGPRIETALPKIAGPPPLIEDPKNVEVCTDIRDKADASITPTTTRLESMRASPEHERFSTDADVTLTVVKAHEPSTDRSPAKKPPGRTERPPLREAS
jgi:hypothetical protein